MAEWKKCKIGDVAELVAGFAFKSNAFGAFPDKVIKITNIDDQGIFSKSLPGVDLSGLDKDKLARYIVREGDYVLAMTGSLGKIGKVVDGEAYINQRVLTIRTKGKTDKRYLYYVLKSSEFLAYVLTHIDSHSVQANISAGTIGEYEFELPPLATQRKIAAVLGAIDDKIETNRKICVNLEAQAQAIFKSWFVDFEPFGGKMPKGWKVVSLGECCNTVLGGTPSRNESTYWGGDIAWINSGKVNDFRIIEASEFITRKGLDYSAAKLMPAKTVVIAITGATLGQVSLLEIEASANQSVIGIIENEEMPYEFIYPLILSRISDLVNCQTGGAQQHINKNDVNGLRFVRPDKKALAEYKNHVSAAYELIAKKCFENRHLEDMRDALLPKLMSGEIDVSKVEVA